MRFLMDDHIYNHASLEGAQDLPKVESFILTRFNVSLPGAREKGGFVDEARFRAWNISRSKIFTRICLPSVLGQTIKPAAWVLLFDERYKEETALALGAIAKHDWIVPVFVKEGEAINSFRQLYTPAIRDRMASDARFGVTIRLDNDDALARVYVEAVTHYAQSAILAGLPPGFWITFPFGVQWDDREVTLMLMNNNPFLALVEDAEKLRSGRALTAMSINHGRVYEHGEVKAATSRFPMWLQYTHQENVSNAKNPLLMAFRDNRRLLRGFSIRPRVRWGWGRK